MTAKTHVWGGLLAGQALALCFLPGTGTTLTDGVLVLSGILGGLLPDIDNENSAITRSCFLTRGLSAIIRSVCAHRGAVHSLVFTLLFFLPAYFAGGRYLRALLAGIGAGCLSHLVLDSFNKSGVMWLWPFCRKRFHLARIRLDGPAEKLFRFLLVAANVVCLVLLIPELKEMVTSVLRAAGILQ